MKPSEGVLHYGLKEDAFNQYINLFKDLSWLNDQGLSCTDDNGHLLGVLCDIQYASVPTLGGGGEIHRLGVGCISNTWRVRNAFRKFHFYRDDMFESAGIEGEEMGRYGKHLRPYMSQNHLGSGDLIPLGQTPGESEWTYSELVSAVAWGDDVIPSLHDKALTTRWPVTVQDKTILNANSGFDMVGMIESYNEDRMDVVTPTLDGETVSKNNPLSMMRYQAQSTGQIVDVAAEQELERPPYDIRDDGDSIYKTSLHFGFGGSQGATEVPTNIILKNVFVPAGLLYLVDNQTPAENNLIKVTCKAVLRCKDISLKAY